MASSCIIADCDIASQYYRLTLAEDGRTVIDFSLYFTSPPRSAWQPVELTTDASLRPCPVCGSRIVNPSRTMCSKYSSSVKPDGTSKFGR